MSAVSHAMRVNVYFSPESKGYWANSPDLNGLAASGDSRKEVEHEALLAAQSLFEILGIEGEPELTFVEATFDEGE